MASLAAPHAMAQAAPDAWKVTLGLGAINEPLYPGSGETKNRALPVISAGYGRYFIGGVPGAGVPAGVGAYLVQQEHWHLGIGLGGNFESPRKESDSPRLRGLGDIDRTALGAVFGSYSDRWFELRAGVLTDIGGKHEGTRISADVEFKYALTDQLLITGGPGITWADRQYTQTFFGVDAAQSAASGLAAYDAKSGINSIRLGLGANYRLTPSWGIGARATFGSLRGDAADSPITEKKSQNTFGVFATYRF
ncbi:MAG TPA: MipA/OmpV family protein [Burkholderiaceae bacterium]